MSREIIPELKLICGPTQRNGVRLSSCAAPTDYQRSSQAFSPRIARESALNHAAGQQKPRLSLVPPYKMVDNRLPGHLFFRNLDAIFGPYGTLGCKGSSRLTHIKEALSACIRWLRKNPKHKGVYGRLCLTQFKMAGNVSFSRAFWWKLRRDLLKAGLISYADDGIRVYVDFAHWDEPIAHAHYEQTRINAAIQKANRRAVLRAAAADSAGVFCGQHVFLKDSTPNRMPPTPPADAEFEVSGHPKGAGAQDVRSAPPAAASPAALADRPGADLQEHSKTQHPTPAPKSAPPPAPEQAQAPARAAEPVLDVGMPERKLGKEGSVAKNYFMTLVAKLPPANPEPAPANKVVPKQMPPVVPPCPAMPDVKRMQAIGADEEQNSAGLTPSTLGVINKTYGLRLSWTILRHTALQYEHLRDAALYATMADEVAPKGWRSLEAIVVNSARERAKGAWGGFKSRKSRR